MIGYLIINTINNPKCKKPVIIFYDRSARKWKSDYFLGDIDIIFKIGKRTKKFGHEVIKYNYYDYIIEKVNRKIKNERR